MVRANQQFQRRVGIADQNATARSRARARLPHYVAAVLACVAATFTAIAPQHAFAQTIAAPAGAATPAQAPAPIYWKQQLFLVPYQWSSAAAPASARLVTLYISRDGGTSWQKISDGRPDLKAFNYRAEGDGEYWFAIRTLDNRGQLWPAGPYQPELRVIVDTTIPRIDELHARPTPDGTIEIQCRATDVNLDPASLKVEVQVAGAAVWQPVALQQVPVIAAPPAGMAALPSALAVPIRAIWQPSPGKRPIALRATIADRAGNSTVYQCPIDATQPANAPLLPQPAPTAATQPLPNVIAPVPIAPAAPALAPTASGTGWSALSVASTPIAAPANPALPPTNQTWPATAAAQAPFQLWTGSAPNNDGQTAYANPPVVNTRSQGGANPIAANTPTAENPPRVPAHFAGTTKAGGNDANAAVLNDTTKPQFAPLEPFRQSSPAPQAAVTSGPSLVPVGISTSAVTSPTGNAVGAASGSEVTPIAAPTPTHRPKSPPLMVGSRTFSLEYDLEDNSRAGVARVELWGTRDGGQTWTRTAVDDDCRSPLVVTVDDEGLYGFKVFVQAANGAPINPPRAGEEPEMWVSVDLKRPIVEFTSIERGEGNLADHLILHWRAQDNNFEPRPISLSFSSRPGGPWSVIATNLENTGEYVWRVERFVPDKFYLQIEARDVAGNSAKLRTRDPVEFNALPTTGRLRSALPFDPTAANTSGALR